MERDLESVERVVLQLANRLARLESRVASLEGAVEDSVGAGVQASAVPLTGTGDGPSAGEPAAEARRPDHVGVLALCGRALLILGGAYLLRALTQGGVLPAAVGVALALAYAGVWFVAAERSARRDGRAAAQMYGLAATLVAFPVVVEAVARFGILDGGGAIAAITVATAVGCTVASRNGLGAVLWAVTLGAVLASGWVFVRASAHQAAAGFAIALVVATALVGRRHGWGGPRWVAAAAADLMVLVVLQVVGGAGELPPSYADVTPVGAVALAVGLIAASLLVVGWSTLRGSGGLSAFEAVQAPAALAIGVSGIAAVVRATALGGSIVGATCVVLGFACYGVAFAFVDRRLGRNRTFFFYTTLGLVLVLSGVLLPASPAVAAVVWGVVGVAMAAVGGWWDRITLRVHAAVFLCGAAVAAGLPAEVATAFGAGDVPRGWIVGAGGAVLLLLLGGYAVLTYADRDREPTWNARLPRFAVGAAAVAGIGAVTIAGIAALWPGEPPGEVVLAAIRTVVLAGAAVALALAGRRALLRELGWLVYPVLLVAGLRILTVDLRVGEPSELVVAFGAFGTALILAPGLLRRAPSG